jgi:hypothetical protein
MRHAEQGAGSRTRARGVPARSRLLTSSAMAIRALRMMVKRCESLWMRSEVVADMFPAWIRICRNLRMDALRYASRPSLASCRICGDARGERAPAGSAAAKAQHTPARARACRGTSSRGGRRGQRRTTWP